MNIYIKKTFLEKFNMMSSLHKTYLTLNFIISICNEKSDIIILYDFNCYILTKFVFLQNIIGNFISLSNMCFLLHTIWVSVNIYHFKEKSFGNVPFCMQNFCITETERNSVFFVYLSLKNVYSVYL